MRPDRNLPFAPRNEHGTFGLLVPNLPGPSIGITGFDTLIRVLFVSAMALLMLATGCTRSPHQEVDANANPKPTVAQKSSPRTNSVATNAAVNLQSPAAPATDVDEVTATPERVCKSFMERLQHGDRIGAENLLTRTALSTTTRANLQLEPVGTPLAKYKIMPARYATTQHKLAQVDCKILDTIDGQPGESNITWLARRQSGGWRISGIMVEFESGNGRDLLSFESIDDVSTIKMLASGQAMDESDESRQANASDAQTTLQ